MATPAFIPALFGSDIGAYSLARSFYEVYGVTSYVFGKYPTGPCRGSKIVAFEADPAIDTEPVLERTLARVASSTDAAVLALGVGDGYVRLLSGCASRMPKNAIVPYLDNGQLDRLIVKENFYRLCDELGIDHPRTLTVHPGEDVPASLPFPYPVVVKASDSSRYFAHPFPGQRKVYFPENCTELVEAIGAMRSAGYEGGVVVQEHIPGNDDSMHVLTCYSDSAGRVSAACLGHVLLEEHTPTGIGNHALIVTERNDELVDLGVSLLERVGFRGLSNIDIRFDARTGRYLFLELNARQGRSNYYAAVAGVSLVRHLVEDVVNRSPLPYEQGTEGLVWTVVPKGVARRYVPASELRETRGRWVNPLFFARDRGLGRMLRLAAGQLNHYRKFRRCYHPTKG